MNEAPPATARIRALIVDDEFHGRDVVRHMLQRHADITVTGEAANGARALEMIRTQRPDLVFLDIRMPKLGGMELVDALGSEAPPVLVFITAHDSYAVEAFQRCAFDYLLKPFDQERFDRTMDRVRERLRAEQDADIGRRLRQVFTARDLASDPPTESVERSSAPVAPLTRFVVKEAGRVFFVPLGAVDWLEAAGNYVGLRVGSRIHLIHETLRKIEQMLDPQQFLRIHRSTIVNVERIRELQPFANGEFVVILHDGTRLKLSRSYRERADEVLGLR